MNTQPKKDFVSINEYLDAVNEGLSQFAGRIIGEVMEVQMYPERSYLFFKIKDTDGANPAVLTCIMWKRDYAMCGLELTVGTELIMSGVPSVYKPAGRFSFNAKTLELVGEGVLKLAYEKLKAKLEAEGLFDESKKRAIPLYPHKIGLITSKGGAVLADFSTNIGKFGYKISFIDSRVEGQLATEELLNSIRTFRNKDIDVLVIIRGGGSLESFLPFNNETLVREVANFPIPVLAGIGHEEDVTLVAMASDRMESTPTAVANFLNRSWEEAESTITMSEHMIIRKFQSTLQGNKDRIRDGLDTMKNAFQDIFSNFSKAEESLKIGVRSIRDQMSDIDRKLDGALIPVFRKMNFSIASIRSTISESVVKEIFEGVANMKSNADTLLTSYEKQLTANDPKRQLRLGYSIVTKNGKILKTTSQIQKGDTVTIGLSEGTFDSEVKSIDSK